MEQIGRQTVRLEQVQVVTFHAMAAEIEVIEQEVGLTVPGAVVKLSPGGGAAAPKLADGVAVTLELPDDAALLDGVIKLVFRYSSEPKVRVRRELRSRPLDSDSNRAPSYWRDGASMWKQTMPAAAAA